MDSAGRLYVADRSNNRIQIFDPDGNFIAEWKQFGRPSGVYIRNDIIYVADSQSNDKVNAPFRQGVRIGSVKDGKVTAFISMQQQKCRRVSPPTRTAMCSAALRKALT
jgi:DNA-binding beta-propeller fold protein YncE